MSEAIRLPGEINQTVKQRCTETFGRFGARLARSRMPIGFAFLLLAVSSNARAQIDAAGAQSKTDHAERSIAAADLAIIAAEAGLLDVSIEALKRAAGKGPPVSSVDLGGLLSSNPNARSTRSSSRDERFETAQVKLAKRLVQLHQIWIEREIDPAIAYDAWKQLILPSNRSNEAFAYSVSGSLKRSISYTGVPFDYERPKVTDCGAAALVHWARLAEKIDDLIATVVVREPFPGAASTALLLKVIMAKDPSSPIADVEALCQHFTDKPVLLVDDPNAELLFGHVWEMFARLEPESTSRKDVITGLLGATESRQRWLVNPWMEFVVAKRLRETIERGDSEQFRQITKVALSRFSGLSSRNTDYIARKEHEMYGEAAGRAFQAGHIKLGADCLRSQSLIVISRGSSSQANAILDPTTTVFQQLLKMDRAERFELFNDLVWNMPALGLADCARMKVSDRIPLAFVSQARGDQQTLRSGEVSAPQSNTISLLEWTMRDAVAVGKEDEILKRIAKIEADGSDDVRLARLMWGLAKHQTLDLSQLTKTADNGTDSLAPCLGASAVIPLDLRAVTAALEDSSDREAGKELLARLAEQATKDRQYTTLAWLRQIEWQSRAGQGDNRTSHHELNHWIVANDVSRDDLMSGQVPAPLWIQRDDKTWGHECGTNLSFLMLRYPLQGDFSISLRSKDGLYEEGGMTFGGVAVEFLRSQKRLHFWGVGYRNATSVDTDAMNEDEFNKFTLARHGDSMTVQVGDNEFEQSVRLVSPASPFFAMCSNYYRTTTFDSLQITGDVVIPRKVELLSPSLLGWTTKFTGQLLPSIGFMPGDKQGVIRSADDEDQPEWRFIDGAIESVDITKSSSRQEQEGRESTNKDELPRHESLIQYLRPLCDGEEVSLEFYQESGKFSLCPSIGRIAMVLSQPKVGLHWITADTDGAWTGVDEFNQIVDEDADQLRQVNLNEHDWNRVVIRLNDGVVTLQLNGEDIYRRQWEPEAGRRIGLFHDPTKNHVRVRNIELSGDWPEKLPNDLMELTSRGR